MKLEAGMYVRTNMGDISKIKSIWENERVFFENKVNIDYFTSDSFGISYLKECKVSHNIIKLLEEGDYVNGEKIDYIIEPDVCGDEELYYGKVHTENCGRTEFIELSQIKTILTKQQFEAMQYIVGE